MRLILSPAKKNKVSLGKIPTSQCKNSCNSCQDLAYFYIFPFTLESLIRSCLFLLPTNLLKFLIVFLVRVLERVFPMLKLSNVPVFSACSSYRLKFEEKYHSDYITVSPHDFTFRQDGTRLRL